MPNKKLNSINKNVDDKQRVYNVYTPQLDKFSDAYRGLAESNPYANVSYKRSWWQSFLSNIGFRTNFDNYLESMSLQAQEYENQLLQKQYNEQYDSPLLQAERERTAGLNPNLTGNVSSGDSSPFVDDGNPPVSPEADDLNMVTGFVGSIMQGLQGAIGLAGSLQGLTAAKLDNNSKLVSLAEDAILHVLPESYEDSNGVDWANVENYYPKLKSMYGNLMSKRQFRNFVGLADNFARGLATGSKKWALNKDRADNRKNFFRIVSGEDYSETDEVMRSVSKELSDLALRLFKERTYADTQSALNDADYQNMVRPRENMNAKQYAEGFTGAEKAAIDKRSAEASTGFAEENRELLHYKNELRDSFKTIMGQLDKLSNSGNKFAPIARMVLSATLMKYLGQ